MRKLIDSQVLGSLSASQSTRAALSGKFPNGPFFHSARRLNGCPQHIKASARLHALLGEEPPEQPGAWPSVQKAGHVACDGGKACPALQFSCHITEHPFQDRIRQRRRTIVFKQGAVDIS